MTASLDDELLAAIRAAPDDRALRLVYADWLMERGDPRGEWIALSCGQDSEDTEREMRRRALWQHYGKQWESEDLADSGLQWIAYRDGFPAYASVGGRTHLELPQLALYPIRTLTVYVVPGLLEALADSPILETVRNLHLYCNLDHFVSVDELAAFFDSPALARLEGFGFRTCDDGRAIWPALEQFGRLSELKRLEIYATIDVQRARWLGRSCPALEVLRAVALSGDALRALVETATFRLRTMEIYGDVGEAAIADALASPLARELTELTLDCHGVGELATAALAQMPCAASLRRLRTFERPKLIRAIGDGRFPALESLSLINVDVTDEFAGAMARLPSLTALELGPGQITHAGAARLLSSLPRLERLAIKRMALGDEGAHAIASSEHARSLRHLALEGVDLGSRAVASIVSSGRLNELRRLSLYDNHLGRDSLRSLADGPFDRMDRLSLSDTDADAAAALFADSWLKVTTAPTCTYERKLELSGRAVARKVRAT